MSATAYTPRPTSVAGKVLAWLAANAGQSLTVDQIAALFSTPRNSVPPPWRRRAPSAEYAARSAAHISGQRVLRVERVTEGAAA